MTDKIKTLPCAEVRNIEKASLRLQERTRASNAKARGRTAIGFFGQLGQDAKGSIDGRFGRASRICGKATLGDDLALRRAHGTSDLRATDV
jgi:hypothetical protein